MRHRRRDAQLVEAADAADLGVADLGERLPPDVVPRRPQHADAGEADLRLVGQQRRGRLHVALERGVAARDRIGDAQDVADLQPLDRHRRGQHPVEFEQFEPALAAQHGQRFLLGEQVDRLVPAQDGDAVDDQVALVGLPAEDDRPRLEERLLRGDAVGGVDVAPHLAVRQPLLLVEDDARDAVVLRRVDRRRREHPRRGRLVQRLGPGQRGRRREQGAERREHCQLHPILPN